MKNSNKKFRSKFVKYNIFRSFKYAFEGVLYIFQREKNVWFQMFAGLTLVTISLILKNNVFASLHLVLMLFTISQEMMNTALEELCDHIEPNYNLAIKTIKDVAAASVLVGAFAWIFVIIYQLLLIFGILKSF